MAGDGKHKSSKKQHTTQQPRGMMTMGMEMMHNMGNNFDVDAIRKELEGPMALRVICGLAGLALTVCSVLGMLNIPALVTHPARFLLQIYEAIFGLVICGVELKDVPCHGAVRDLSNKWFPFLTIVGGKGLFYIFVGSLGAAFGMINLLVFIPAMAVLACGVVLVLFHFGKCKQIGEKYDMTVMHTTMLNPPAQEYH